MAVNSNHSIGPYKSFQLQVDGYIKFYICTWMFILCLNDIDLLKYIPQADALMIH